MAGKIVDDIHQVANTHSVTRPRIPEAVVVASEPVTNDVWREILKGTQLGELDPHDDESEVGGLPRLVRTNSFDRGQVRPRLATPRRSMLPHDRVPFPPSMARILHATVL